jgi:outer membrane lipase/esterase
MNLKAAASVAALCVALFGAASAAQAQSYDRLVVFGDSLSDNGNLYSYTSSHPPLPPSPTSPPYYNGRFSNGPTWVELLGFSLSHYNGSPAGNIDWAFGGARTDFNTNPPLALPFGIRSQVNNYLGSGGAFGGGDLVTLWGGANDLFAGMAQAGADPANAINIMQNTVGAAAANIGLVVNQIAGAGAGTLLVANLPDLGATPQFNTNASASVLASISTQNFNALQDVQLRAQAAAHPGTNIIRMDVFRVGGIIKARPELFGLTNVTQNCLVGATPCATPNTYMYWDTVHPTAKGHQLLAALAVDYLEYGDRAVPTAAEGEAGLRLRGRAYDAGLDALEAPAEEGWHAFVSYDHDSTSVDARGLMPSGDGKADSVRIGLRGDIGSGLRGGATVSYSQGDEKAGPVAFKPRSYAIDLYGAWRGETLFVDGVAGVGRDDYQDITRVTGVGLLVNTAATHGWSYGAKGRLGARFDWNGMTVSPRAALSWSRADVDGYAEDGFTARHLIADRAVTALEGEATVRLDARLGDRFAGWAEAGYGGMLNYDADAVHVGLVDNTAQVLAREVDEPQGGHAVVNAGVEGRLTDRLSLGLGYRGRLGGGADSNLGALTLKMRF